jgi:hypothetical protein
VKFKPGDLVLIVGSGELTACRADIGKIGTVNRRCDSCHCGMMAELLFNLSFYQLNGFPNGCYREDALKKIDGDREKTRTEETRDAPVAA